MCNKLINVRSIIIIIIIIIISVIVGVSVVMKRCQSQQILAPDDVYVLAWVGEGNYLKE